jgi:hypothetical protein
LHPLASDELEQAAGPFLPASYPPQQQPSSADEKNYFAPTTVKYLSLTKVLIQLGLQISRMFFKILRVEICGEVCGEVGGEVWGLVGGTVGGKVGGTVGVATPSLSI